MATRNLYERTTVEATFLYAIQTGSTHVAEDALLELEDSGIDTASLLTKAWLLAPPQTRFLEKEERRSAVLSLPPHTRPPSLLPFPPPTNDLRAECPWTPRSVKKAATVWHAIRDALEHGRVARAVRLALSVSDDDLESLLVSFRLSTKWRSLLSSSSDIPRDRVLFHAFANKTADPPRRSTPTRRTNGRSFSIDPRALAQEGLSSPPTSLLLGLPLWVTEDDASPWWKAALRKYGIVVSDGFLEGGTAEATEAFYTECFPNDIPDEWSIRERAKSHGLFVPSSALATNPS
jgi:hypothetical protein